MANTIPEVLNPSDIIAPFELSGRQERPDVAGFVSDFDSPSIGQLAAVGVRPKRADEFPDDDRAWVLVWGFSRHLAALQLNKDRRKVPKAQRKQPFLLKVTLAHAKTDEATFTLTTLENVRRNQLTPLEIAHSMQKFSTDFGYTNQRIAKRFGVSAATVTETLKLLDTTPKIRRRLADPDDPLSARAAAATVGAPASVVKKVENGNLSKVHEIRTAMIETGEAKKPRSKAGRRARPSTIYRTTKQARVFFDLLSESSNKYSKGVGAVLDKWLKSKLTDKAAIKQINALLES